MQCSAGKPWFLAFMWVPFYINHPPKTHCRPSAGRKEHPWSCVSIHWQYLDSSEPIPIHSESCMDLTLSQDIPWNTQLDWDLRNLEEKSTPWAFSFRSHSWGGFAVCHRALSCWSGSAPRQRAKFPRSQSNQASVGCAKKSLFQWGPTL